MKYLPLPLFLAVILIPLVAAAEGPPENDFNRPGLYAGVNGAFGLDFFKDDFENVLPGAIDVKDTGGLNARVGYRIFSWLAVEAHYEWMHEFSTEVGDLAGFDTTAHTLTGNMKFYLPFNWRFQPYIGGGVGVQGGYTDGTGLLSGIVDDTSWDFAGRPFAGLDIYVTRNFLINAEVAGVVSIRDLKTPGATANDLWYTSFSGGFQYRF